ncbi:MAG: hypothetical protein KDA84_10875 [Planctomycetaceae bacterium]|nr:hypothetical protein [Planctomycetaceae bacterium]
MNSDPQISVLLNHAKDGDEKAITRLFEYYYPKLARFAEHKIQGAPRQMADGDDIAACAIASFYKAARLGRFPALQDRQGLWRLLITMTARKAIDHWRRETGEENGGGNVHNEPCPEDSNAIIPSLDQWIINENTPEFEVMMVEACTERLKVLGPQLQDVALAKLEGYTNREVAERLGITERAVEYSLKTIRKTWERLNARESEMFSEKSENES